MMAAVGVVVIRVVIGALLIVEPGAAGLDVAALPVVIGVVA